MSSVLIIMSFINSTTSYFLAKLIFLTITAVLIGFSANKKIIMVKILMQIQNRRFLILILGFLSCEIYQNYVIWTKISSIYSLFFQILCGKSIRNGFDLIGSSMNLVFSDVSIMMYNFLILKIYCHIITLLITFFFFFITKTLTVNIRTNDANF